ncbi:MAG: transposase [Minisyncoccia bacterium]
MRDVPFVAGEFYHIYNRGVDKRDVFMDEDDLERFLQSMRVFNTIEPCGSIFEQYYSRGNDTPSPSDMLVHIVCYCLNPNHYHLLLEEVAENGISEFMKRIGGGYTKYFNEKYERSGSLFQGRFKSVHIGSDSYLKTLSVYINLNNMVHKIRSKFFRSSWMEYVNHNNAKKVQMEKMCFKRIILDSFSSVNGYEKFANETISAIISRRYEEEPKKGKRVEKKSEKDVFLE